MDSVTTTTPAKKQDTPAASRESLTIVDNRTGKSYEVPIKNGAIRAMDLRQIKVDPNEFGMLSYDPAYNNTASCISRVTFIDGDAGILRYRGYPIEELAEKSTYLETAYLLLHGELPNASQLKDWTYNVTHHTGPEHGRLAAAQRGHRCGARRRPKSRTTFGIGSFAALD